MILSKNWQVAVAGVSMMAMVATGLVGCAGATPHPVPQYQPGDKLKTCEQIRLEVLNNQTKILDLIPKENKTGKNVALGVAGYFLLVPWFFMDFSDAERIEVQAYELRNNYLMTLANQKQCKSMPLPIKFKDKQ